MLSLRLRFGDQPISVSAIFNTREDRAVALAQARAVDNAESFSRRLTVEKILLDPVVRIPSSRFFRSIWFATGLQLERTQTKWWLLTEQELPTAEFARRRVDCLRLVRGAATETERDAMELDLPVGVGIANLGDRIFWIELCGTESAIEVAPAVASSISSSDPYLFSRPWGRAGTRTGPADTELH
jgi:hypothetical protein